MEIILLEKIENLGKVGDRVAVRPGYARNYLFPKSKALPATAENVATVEARRAELERAALDFLGEAKTRAQVLEGKVITLARKAGQEGRLFGSVGTLDIAQALHEMTGVTLEKHHVRLATGPLREVGEHEVVIHLHPDVNVSVTVNVIAEA
jgi:large subunit ribosomal protein L9